MEESFLQVIIAELIWSNPRRSDAAFFGGTIATWSTRFCMGRATPRYLRLRKPVHPSRDQNISKSLDRHCGFRVVDAAEEAISAEVFTEDAAKGGGHRWWGASGPITCANYNLYFKFIFRLCFNLLLVLCRRLLDKACAFWITLIRFRIDQLALYNISVSTAIGVTSWSPTPGVSSKSMPCPADLCDCIPHLDQEAVIIQGN